MAIVPLSGLLCIMLQNLVAEALVSTGIATATHRNSDITDIKHMVFQERC